MITLKETFHQLLQTMFEMCHGGQRALRRPTHNNSNICDARMWRCLSSTVGDPTRGQELQRVALLRSQERAGPPCHDKAGPPMEEEALRTRENIMWQIDLSWCLNVAFWGLTASSACTGRPHLRNCPFFLDQRSGGWTLWTKISFYSTKLWDEV